MLKRQVRDLLAPACIGMWLIFVLTGSVLGWGTGYVFAAVVWLALFVLTVKACS
jgi:hypothetical protein